MPLLATGAQFGPWCRVLNRQDQEEGGYRVPRSGLMCQAGGRRHGGTGAGRRAYRMKSVSGSGRDPNWEDTRC